MIAAFQASLLDIGDETGPGVLAARRTMLDHGAWIDVQPGWMRNADELFEELFTRVPWRLLRPRGVR